MNVGWAVSEYDLNPIDVDEEAPVTEASEVSILVGGEK